jgi:hypothetical protein
VTLFDDLYAFSLEHRRWATWMVGSIARREDE